MFIDFQERKCTYFCTTERQISTPTKRQPKDWKLATNIKMASYHSNFLERIILWLEALTGSHIFNVLVVKGWFISVKNSNVSYYFLNIIYGDNFSQQELIRKLLESVLMYYVNMGASQFLRDFRRECYVQKSVASDYFLQQHLGTI